jgi:hypothetical protein
MHIETLDSAVVGASLQRDSAGSLTTGSLKLATKLVSTVTSVALSTGLVVMITGAAAAGAKAARALLSATGTLTAQV